MLEAKEFHGIYYCICILCSYGKYDDSLESKLCKQHGQPLDCDVCQVANWYNDGECDSFCRNYDEDCGAQCNSDEFAPLPSDTFFSKTCGQKLYEIISSPLIETSKTTISHTDGFKQRCEISEFEKLAVEYFYVFMDDAYGWDVIFEDMVEDGEEIPVDISTFVFEKGTGILVEMEWIEMAASLIFDQDDVLVLFYNHDIIDMDWHVWYCAQPGEEELPEGDYYYSYCVNNAISFIPRNPDQHSSIDKNSGTVSSPEDIEQLEYPFKNIIDKYITDYSIDIETIPLDYSYSTSESLLGVVTEMKVSDSNQEITYIMGARKITYSYYLFFEINQAEDDINFVCQELE